MPCSSWARWSNEGAEDQRLVEAQEGCALPGEFPYMKRIFEEQYFENAMVVALSDSDWAGARGLGDQQPGQSSS
jgi:hypothetical protein